MNKNRLNMLCDFLEGVNKFEGKGARKDKFHLDLWNGAYKEFDREFKYETDESKPIFERLNVKNKKTKILEDAGKIPVVPGQCQTAGCAVGWAAAMPEFNKMGLYLVIDENNFDEPYYNNVANLSYVTDNGFVYDIDGAEKFFNISIDEFWYFFKTRAYSKRDAANPKAVAKRIREYMTLSKEQQEKKIEKRKSIY